MAMRGVLILGASIVLPMACATSTPAPHAPDGPHENPEALQKNAREILQREAHFFALIKPAVPEGNTTSISSQSSGTSIDGARRFRRRGEKSYAGFLTPRRKDGLYVVGAAALLRKKEQFQRALVFFYNEPKKGHPADLVGEDRTSKMLVFRLERTSLERHFKHPPAPVQKPTLRRGETVISLGHPRVPKKKGRVFWAVSFGSLDYLGSDLIHHSGDLGRLTRYWHGGPLVRVTSQRTVEILGMNMAGGALFAHRALPYAEVINVRDRVIEETRNK